MDAKELRIGYRVDLSKYGLNYVVFGQIFGIRVLEQQLKKQETLENYEHCALIKTAIEKLRKDPRTIDNTGRM